MGKNDDEEEAVADNRMSWIKDRVCLALKVKPDKFDDMDEVALFAVKDFLDQVDCNQLFIYLGDRDAVMASTGEPPGTFKKKGCYFYKVEEGKMKMDPAEIKEQMVWGDFSKNPLHQLLDLAQAVYLPILMDPAEQDQWPQVMAAEFAEKAAAFVGTLTRLIGQVAGQTVLPLPLEDVKPGQDASKETLYALEGCIVTWTDQIKLNLRTDPDDILKENISAGAMNQIDFWEAKLANLNSIRDQLNSPKIRKILKVLKLATSTYLPAFERLVQAVDDAHKEASQMVPHLKTLDPYLGILDASDDFSQIEDLIRPIFHGAKLLWVNGQYFNTPQRLLPFLKMMVNDVVKQCQKSCDSESLFEVETPEAVGRIDAACKLGLKVQADFFEYKRMVMDEHPKNPWSIPANLVFSRLDLFLERAKDAKTLLETIVQFHRLEKIEIGGTKGQVLTESIQQMYATYIGTVLKIFEGVTYDIFDIDDNSFEEDYMKFSKWVQESDTQMVSIIVQALTDCISVDAAFSLFDSFEGIIERRSIQMALEKNFLVIVQEYTEDLSEILQMFLADRDDPPIYNNMPPISGALNWSLGLELRASAPMAKIRKLASNVTESDEMAEAEASYTQIIELIHTYNLHRQEDWAKEVDISVVGKLKQSLLRQESDQYATLAVNFDPALVRLLREVSYFVKLDLEVPDTAMAIYKKAETFRQQTGNLQLVVQKYNWIKRNLLDVEKPLVAQELEAIDQYLEKGINGLNWKSVGINEFVQEASAMVRGCEMILTTLKDNVKSIESILEGFGTPVLSRSDQSILSIDELVELHDNTVGDRQDKFGESADIIHTTVQGSKKCVKVHKGSNSWMDYIDYLNSVVCNGYVNAISNSLTALAEQVDAQHIKSNDLMPLVSITLDLEMGKNGAEVLFTPDLNDFVGRHNIRDTMISMMKDYHALFNQMKRLCTGNGDYTVELEERITLRDGVGYVIDKLKETEQSCKDFRDVFMKFEHLWTKDLQESFKEWWEEVAVVPPEPEDAVAEAEEGEGEKKPVEEEQEEKEKYPPIEAFDAKITEYADIKTQCNALPSEQDIGWLRVDAKPIRAQLLYWATQWMALYTDYLRNKVVGSMEDMSAFCEHAAGQFGEEVADGDEAGLTKMLESIRDVKKRTKKYDNIIEPLREETSMLKKHGIEVPIETIQAMEEGQDKWEAVKTKMFSVKEGLNEQYNKKGDAIKKEAIMFARTVTIFRDEFQKKAPFKFAAGLETCYEALQEQWEEITRFNKDSAALKELQELYELVPTDFKEIRDSTKEAVLLKQVWDTFQLVDFTFQDWRTTLWDDIDTDYLMDEAKKLKDVVKKLDKKTRVWDVYKGLEDEVANMMVALPLIQLLKSPAMRQRHWKELMVVTSTNFTMDSNFCLADLVNLQLHRFEEDVEGVVIKSQKELTIEKNLKKIEEIWAVQDIIYNPYAKDETVNLMKVAEETVEFREEHQVGLQAMQASKYIKVFEEQVNTWLSKLGGVEAVCSAWQAVQDKWMQLESIFIGSEDIRAQLPEDSKRFDTIDEDWRAIMSESVGIPNAVEVCNRENQLEKLEKMEEMLDLCQKALDEYLGTKRTAFPRFYFVAPADLLDILSKGSNPIEIQPHYSKCFDNVGKLEFDPDEAATGKAMKAVGMWSGDKEYVEFPEVFDATGDPVEVYLQRLVDHQHESMKLILQDGLGTYAPDNRHKWLFNYNCQVVLVAAMVWWTSEVTQAFAAFEDGMDTALKDQWQNQVDQLKHLSTLVRGDLDKGDRRKIVTLITIDVHARDVIMKLITRRVEDSQCFEWLSQLRLEWSDEANTCHAMNCDSIFIYGYEYVGNCGRLVITPLTDRCYITLTQASRLRMGGAPAGPAGTGKTETTKDLGRALGIIVYVFNCSPQMTSSVMANIFKGLSATGGWGCFDEFNRIAIETLSVIATQYRCVLMAIRGQAGPQPFVHHIIGDFNFDGEICSLVPTAMGFITMNPGYAGRTELPENVKALFRPVAMIVPDMEMICEIMLFSEGFEDARTLARKFMLLFRLNKDLLSVQVHYDWGLRAVKSILVIAGSLKRADPDILEDGVLMRALRDCNVPKLVLDDVDVFLGTVTDIFPGINLPRRRDPEFETKCRDACKDQGLQAEEIFLAKISAVKELFEVRHSVFILGPPGSGKTALWNVLEDAMTRIGAKTIHEVINPKAQTADELYGFIHPVVGWKDGIFSYVMRNFSQMTNDWFKWIVLDGDVDPDWIESLNTVMDDNKMLTLASNERVALNPTMRLLLEVADLRNASPATVSRGGVLMLNERDIGFRPFVDSWINKRCNAAERTVLSSLFDAYADTTIDFFRRNIKAITNVMEINMIMTICYLLDALLLDDEKKEVVKEVTEVYFVWACIWGFGSSLSIDKGVDYRKEFAEWWKLTWQVVKIPGAEELGADPAAVFDVFDFRVDPKSHQLVVWDGLIPGYVHVPDLPFYSIAVANKDSVRLTSVMNLLADNQHHVQFCGLAGTAKTTTVKEKLRAMDEDWSSSSINCNSRTDALGLQFMCEGNLEKRAGRTYAPIGNKKHIYFLDDCNMPGFDKWGTQTPIELMHQLFCHKFFYDRNKIGIVKEVQKIQFLSAMNPTAGSFSISGRLQRQFTCMACNLPSTDAIEQIYKSILTGHLSTFDTSVQDVCEQLVTATVTLHGMMLKFFLPNAIKFHYTWNLRELANIFQGLCGSTPQYYVNPTQLARLWINEATRVYGDRLMTDEDIDLFVTKRAQCVSQTLPGVDQDKVLAEPILFTNFCNGEDDTYLPCAEFEKLNKILTEKLTEYNEANAVMELVLFDMFMEHVCRISRVLMKARGNCMCVGVGGSGKQSLTKLTSFIGDFTCFQIQLTGNYTIGNLKEDILTLYKRAGCKGERIVWLLTDAQIVQDAFLVYINDFLSSGLLPDLMTLEDKGDCINAVRNEVKSEGIVDTNENCWEFFIDKVRSNLHIVFCMSPVGDKMRVWCRKFPALINCSVIDWVHSWPQVALESVATRFLGSVDFGEEGLSNKLALHMAYVHTQTVSECKMYLEVERRYNYATPKSYLEFIDLYKTLLGQKRGALETEFNALELGLQKLLQTEEDVGQLKIRLEEESVFVKEKSESTDKLIVVVGKETAIVNENKAMAAIENEKANIEKESAGKVQAECDFELGKAEPLVQAALAALDTLSKDAVGELKGFSNPPNGIEEVCACVIWMLSPEGKLAKDASFKAAKKAMSNPGEFVGILKGMDIDNIPRANIAKVKQQVDKFDLSEEGANSPIVIGGRSLAAGGLANWVVNIIKYDDCYQMITPLRNNLAEALAKLAAATAIVKECDDLVANLEAKLAKLTSEFEEATKEKNELVANAELTEKKLVMAERLIGGLASEKVRWASSIKSMKENARLLIGDTVCAAAFVSYIGAFSAPFRMKLTDDIWIPDMQTREIPCTEGGKPLDLLADASQRAVWNNENLPADNLSIENAAIITACARWPLMIDPQLQGVTWIKTREQANDMKVITLGGKFLDTVERAISMGNPLIIENIAEAIDAVLEPVLSRAVVKRGGMVFIKLGDKDDVEYDSNFKLYLQTKMPNPHYQPEIAAQTTLINFTVTQSGLEDQLLAVVVQHERPDLQEQMVALVRESNECTKLLKDLADGLLYKLSTAEGNLIEDIDLIENLENTKKTAVEVEQKQVASKQAEKDIAVSREKYRPSAAQASLIYFVLNNLWIVDHMYQYSLDGFMRVFEKAIGRAEPSDDVQQRVKNVTDNVTYTLFCYASRGLFARHKLTFAAQLTFKIMGAAGDLPEEHFNWILRYLKVKVEKPQELEWMSDGTWYAANALIKLEGFENLTNDLVSSSKRFKEWSDLEAPEKEKLPLEYKNLAPLPRLCLIRCLRPDRMTMVTEGFVEEYMGKRYTEDASAKLVDVLPELDAATPVYYILSPGVDVVGEIESQATQRGFTLEEEKWADISLGEGKDIISDREVDRLAKEGGWVVLQNIHLMPIWLIELEKRIERNAPNAHPDFRLFLTSDPSNTIPVALLQRSIKLTQEPPPGLKALVKRSWKCFDDNTWDASSKQGEMKSMLFALSYFHAVMVERIKFGPQGWNRKYPFNLGDLTVCAAVTFNYLESSGSSIPWEDLRYIYGEIMYGGHITDDFDRLYTFSLLDKLMKPDLFEGMELYPTFPCPANLNHAKMMEYIEENMGTESPVMFGMHPNAELGFRTDQSNVLYATLAEVGGGGGSGGGGGASSMQEKVQALIEETNERLAEGVVDMEDLISRIDGEGGRTPYVNVFFQECKYMNSLVLEIKKSLEVLTLGLLGELQMSESMETLQACLFENKVAPSWMKLSFESMRPLAGWMDNLLMRLKQLMDWQADLMLPKVAWLSGFFNPKSFLTAILQAQARKNEWPLDKVVVAVEVTKKAPEEVADASKEGSYIHGLSMEGARWDGGQASVSNSLPKEMFFTMPVMLAKAIPVDKAEFKDTFMCPVYKTQTRGYTYVFQANLKTRVPHQTWILAGVACLMDIVL